MLEMTERKMDVDTIRAALKTHVFGARIEYRVSVTSTNDIAKQLAETGAPEGTVVCAEEQTAGRGRMQRSWTAPAYSSILTSIILRPSLQPEQMGRLGMAFGLGLADAVQQETGLNALLKWPNDLVINGKKCAGMLAEADLVGRRIDYVVVGIGLNVNWNAASLQGAPTAPTSIADELGHPFPREALLASFLNHSEQYYTRVGKGQSLRDEWSQRCETLGHEIRAVTPWGEETGKAEDVNEVGSLLLRRADGSLVELAAADVSLHTG